MMRIGNREFDTKRHTYVMGILNVTPDSFSDGGKWNEETRALKHVEQMLEEGADIIDVGGESTRPGYTVISEEEEIARVTPIITKIKREFNIPVSLDTYKSKVAQAGLLSGADLINDIWGLKKDERMAQVIAKADAACCLMHNRKEAVYSSFVEDVVADLRESLEMAEKAGVRKDGICIDPGVGFAKKLEENLLIIKEIDKLHALSYPILLGTSRKSVIGLTLDLPAAERVEGTLVTTVCAVMNRCGFVRVHDVKENVRAIKMAEAIRDCE